MKICVEKENAKKIAEYLEGCNTNLEIEKRCKKIGYNYFQDDMYQMFVSIGNEAELFEEIEI